MFLNIISTICVSFCSLFSIHNGEVVERIEQPQKNLFINNNETCLVSGVDVQSYGAITYLISSYRNFFLDNNMQPYTYFEQPVSLYFANYQDIDFDNWGGSTWFATCNQLRVYFLDNYYYGDVPQWKYRVYFLKDGNGIFFYEFCIVPSSLYSGNTEIYNYEGEFYYYPIDNELIEFAIYFNRYDNSYFYEMVGNNVHYVVQEAYNDGYNFGYDVGMGVGFQNGYSTGYSDGTNVDATASTIFTGVLDVALIPVNVFLTIFNFEVFGINIGGIVSGLLTLSVVIIVLRFIFGGKKDD